MRILSIGNFTGCGWDGSITDENHIADSLEKLGHEVIREQREEDWLRCGDNDIDFTLLAQWDKYPNDMSHLPKPIIYWAFDYQADGQDWHERLIKQSDLYLSKRIADSKYPNWRWLSQDFAPEFLDKYSEPIKKDIDVLFTGSYLPWANERNEILKAVDDRFNLIIHSVNSWEGFKDVRPPIMDDKLPELYARAKVILSIDHTIEAGYWSDRNAQIMACGEVPLFRYVPLSESRFKDYVHYFYNKEDCLNKIEFLLNSKIPYINNRTYEYAQENLKVINRVKELITIVESIL